ncbi:UNVERIFIED_CONTAM: hypothetical protein FKN15_076520 [Acipenser sinensis]
MPGAFQGWKVVLLTEDDEHRQMFERVLKAGNAIVYQQISASSEITHVFKKKVEIDKEHMKALNVPCYSVSYIGEYLYGKDIAESRAHMLDSDEENCLDLSQCSTVNSLTDILTDFDMGDEECSKLENTLKDEICAPEALKSKYVPTLIDCYITDVPQGQSINSGFSQGSIHRIEYLLADALFTEALEELRYCLSAGGLPPAPLIHSLMKHALEAAKIELVYILHSILGVVVEYWIRENLNWDLTEKGVKDLAEYLVMLCEDFSFTDLETLITYQQSPWLNMFTADAIYRKFCLQNSIAFHPEPLSLFKISRRKLCFYCGIFGIVADHAGWTPLHEACNHGSVECVHAILQHCPDVDLLTQVDGVSPLHDALSVGELDIAKLLLRQGGAVLLQQRDKSGRTPLDYVHSLPLKEELLDIVREGNSPRDGQGDKLLDGAFLEMCSCLLSCLIMNYLVVYNLPMHGSFESSEEVNSQLARFVAVHTFEKVTSMWKESQLIRHAKDIETLLKMSEYYQQVPTVLKKSCGIHSEILLAYLQILAFQSEQLNKKQG